MENAEPVFRISQLCKSYRTASSSRPALEARVTQVEPSAVTKISALGIEEQRVSVVLELASKDKAVALDDGFCVEARITVWEGKDILKVPVAALFRQGQDWAVFAVAGGQAELRRVEIGRRNGELAEVIAGTSEDDTVILHPPDEVVPIGSVLVPGPGE